MLAAESLPVQDLDPGMLGKFLLAESGTRIDGLIGLQVVENDGLLRSLVVHSDARGCGLGETLVRALEAEAAKAGLESLWLLTTDVAKFFARHGYEERARDSAPRGLRKTSEFSSLCPADAQLMYKSLAVKTSE